MKIKFLIGLLVIGTIFISGCAEKECKTNEDCLTKTCFTVQCMDNKCVYSSITNCCGNKICEVGETYPECAADCPNCDDKNECTIDEYDYHKQKCVNAPILDVVCCGNSVCEAGETYSNCARDCPNCDDDNECTEDSYDYHEQKCINEPIIPCCGNEICDEDAETYLSCESDCPNCDDTNRLTTDSFNYATQKCENIVTHYFIDDFEEGTQNWEFPEPTAWSTIVEDDNTFLRGTGHNWAKLQKDLDNYIFKFRFKRIKGGLGVNFRLFKHEHGMSRYIIHLSPEVVSLQNRYHPGPPEEQNINFRFDENWHTLEIRDYNRIFNVYIDDELLIKYKDAVEHAVELNPSGIVAFEVGDNSEFLFDDVEIKVISEEDIVYP